MRYARKIFQLCPHSEGELPGKKGALERETTDIIGEFFLALVNVGAVKVY